MKDEQLTKIDEICKMLKDIPFWTEMFQPPKPSDFEPTGYILIWMDGRPSMVHKSYLQRIMQAQPECWCRIVPPRQRTKNGK